MTNVTSSLVLLHTVGLNGCKISGDFYLINITSYHDLRS